ncbi:unnamed protein product, partial [Rotaria socialis]
CDFVEFGSFESSCNSPENLEWPKPKTKTNKRKGELSSEIAIEALRLSGQDYKNGLNHIMDSDPCYAANYLMRAGPLLAEAITPEGIACKAFWDERITVRVMGPGEYFYKPEPRNSRRDISSSIPPHMIQFREFQARWLERRQSEAANQTESSISVSPKVSTTNNNILVIDLTSDSHLTIEATTATNLDVYATMAIEVLESILATLESTEEEI